MLTLSTLLLLLLSFGAHSFSNLNLNLVNLVIRVMSLLFNFGDFDFCLVNFDVGDSRAKCLLYPVFILFFKFLYYAKFISIY